MVVYIENINLNAGILIILCILLGGGITENSILNPSGSFFVFIKNIKIFQD